MEKMDFVWMRPILFTDSIVSKWESCESPNVHTLTLPCDVLQYSCGFSGDMGVYKICCAKP